MEYFSDHGGKVYAILNCQQRKKDDDAMVTMQLDTREYSLYEEMKNEGKADSTIFKTLFPPRVETRKSDTNVSISVNELNKRQLVYLITQELGHTLKTLPRMSTSDLRTMLVVMQKKAKK